jgi:hypothetical protein
VLSNFINQAQLTRQKKREGQPPGAAASKRTISI